MTSIPSQTVTSFHRNLAGVVSQGSSLIRRLFVNWRDHGAVDQLWRLDDRLLRDSGLDRSDVEWAMHLPLTINPKEALRTRVRKQ